MAKFYKSPTSGLVYESHNGKPWESDHIALNQKDGKAAQRDEAVARLRELLKPGQNVYTVLKHRSASGMSRSISCVVALKNGEILNLDWSIGRALDLKFDQKNGGLIVTGCGMDMGFHLVYNLGRTLWPAGTRKGRGGKPDKDAGYALNQQWL